MDYCKNCQYSLDITRNTKRDEGNIKTISKPEELYKLKPSNDLQYIINFNEVVLKEYLKEKNIEGDDYNAVIDKFKRLLKQQKTIAPFMFLCTNCGSSFVIQPGTILYDFNLDTKGKATDEDDIELKCQDPILPRTKDYICPNKSCKSHNNSLEKEAVFYRNSSGYNLRYICCECKTQWSVSQ
jgi:hypothetical protein